MFIIASRVQKKPKDESIVTSIRFDPDILAIYVKFSYHVLQGTVLVSLRDSGMPIDDNELRRHLSQFGDIKNIRPIPGRPDQRYVEMFDTRVWFLQSGNSVPLGSC